MQIGKTVISSIFLGIILAGCASTQFAPQEQSSKAKSFSVDSGKANIYLYKTEADEGDRGQISINGKIIGKLTPNAFYRLVVSPGAYRISTVGEDTSVVQIETEPGKNYFVWQDVVKGTAFGGRTTINYKLQTVSEETGKKSITESRMMLSSF